MGLNIDQYLARLGLDHAPPVTLAGLRELQLRHLIAVPFENLDVYLQRAVSVDPASAIDKIVDRGRGGWCFELNGAFAELLRALGFDVLLLGAATLFDGPSDVVDHLMLEVSLDQPYLVDVGFGRQTPLAPLPLNERLHPQGFRTYELVPSPKGTTLALIEDDKPAALCRFKRVGHELHEFDAASRRLQDDPTSIFRRSPFATRLIDDSGARVTWSDDELTFSRAGSTDDCRPVPQPDRLAVLRSEFGLGGVDLDPLG